VYDRVASEFIYLLPPIVFPLPQMGISTTIEVEDVQPVSYSRLSSEEGGEKLWVETDWTGLLPQSIGLKASIQQWTQSLGLKSYPSRVRLVEAVLFTLAVLLIIYNAALGS